MSKANSIPTISEFQQKHAEESYKKNKVDFEKELAQEVENVLLDEVTILDLRLPTLDEVFSGRNNIPLLKPEESKWFWIDGQSSKNEGPYADVSESFTKNKGNRSTIDKRYACALRPVLEFESKDQTLSNGDVFELDNKDKTKFVVIDRDWISKKYLAISADAIDVIPFNKDYEDRELSYKNSDLKRSLENLYESWFKRDLEEVKEGDIDTGIRAKIHATHEKIYVSNIESQKAEEEMYER